VCDVSEAVVVSASTHFLASHRLFPARHPFVRARVCELFNFPLPGIVVASAKKFAVIFSCSSPKKNLANFPPSFGLQCAEASSLSCMSRGKWRLKKWNCIGGAASILTIICFYGVHALSVHMPSSTRGTVFVAGTCKVAARWH
jgi:hypothetical protein